MDEQEKCTLPVALEIARTQGKGEPPELWAPKLDQTPPVTPLVGKPVPEDAVIRQPPHPNQMSLAFKPLDGCPTKAEHQAFDTIWADIQPLKGGGFRLQLSLSCLPELQTWLGKFTPPERLFRINAFKLDDYGNYFLWGSEPFPSTARVQAAICGWSDRPKAVEFLRSTSLEEEPVNTSSIYARQIVAALGIAEAPLNAGIVPASCRTEWGPLLRLTPKKAEEALSYLCVDQPADCSVPLVVKLSPTMTGVFGWGRSDVEPLRIALAGSWGTAIALRDVERWLKSLTPRKKAAAGAKGDQND
jgi:hypothetical protein